MLPLNVIKSICTDTFKCPWESVSVLPLPNGNYAMSVEEDKVRRMAIVGYRKGSWQPIVKAIAERNGITPISLLIFARRVYPKLNIKG